MSVFTGKAATPEMQALGTQVAKHVMASCIDAMEVASEHFASTPPGESSSSIAQGVIAGLIHFAHWGNVPPEHVRELIIGATDDMLAQMAMHKAAAGKPIGRA